MNSDKLDKIISEEILNAVSLQEMSEIQKEKGIKNVISRIYMMIMRGQIDDAKKQLADDPEFQRMATDLDNTITRVATMLSKDEDQLKRTLTALSKLLPPEKQ